MASARLHVAGAILLLCALSYAELSLAARMQRHDQKVDSSKIVDVESRSSWEDDEVVSVPGYNGRLPSRHYAGYIPVGTGGKKLFFYFVEAEESPQDAPVVLWLNGGPGCSSFDGFVYEHGPFNFKLVDDSKRRPNDLRVKLTANPYAWNKVANMLFLDSPAGVGLSYSTEGSHDYITDDDVTARDAEEFLRRWFERYGPWRKSRFFISGESYAGVYVPNLARAVVEGNERGAEPHINIEGYLVGNAVTDQVVDGNALPLFAAGKSLITQDAYNKLWHTCDHGNFWNATYGSECDNQLNDLVDDLARLNVYDVLEPCYLGPNDDDYEEEHADAYIDDSDVAANRKRVRAQKARLNSMQQAVAQLKGARQWPLLGSAPRVGQRVQNWAHLGLTPPCTDARAGSAWLNDDRVREALHAEPVNVIGPWTLCSNKISYTRVISSLIPIHKSLTRSHGLRALVYSGDHDMAVPHTGSEYWTANKLDAPQTRPWRPWVVGEQVAGYVVDYGLLSYATIKGAGHMVPENKPRESLAMFQRFLDNQPLAH